MYSLVVVTGKHKGRKIDLPDREVTIGRDEGSFIRMTSAEVSRSHCALVPTDKGLLVRDLSSQNGTVVNNVRIERETLLQPGDCLQVGPVQFQLEESRAPRAQGALEDDIFGWLSESDSGSEVADTSDTTVVKAFDLHPVPEGKTKFRSLAEEAREIIRRHLESLEEG